VAFRRTGRSSTLVRGRGIRRSTEWGVFSPTGFTNIPAGASVLVGSFSGATLASVVPGTIVRVRGSLLWQSDQVAADEDQIGAVGLSVVSENARVAGIASVPQPTPVGWGDDKFFMTLAMQNSGIGGIAAGRQHIQQQDFDSKAMRKLNDGDGIAIVASNWGAHGANLVFAFRILFMKGRSG